MPCVAYPELTGPIALDDEVLVNSQARDLELGSGGFDVLYANLTRGLELPAGQGAHVVMLPYTPAQFAALHAEERRRARRRVGWDAGGLLLAPQPAGCRRAPVSARAYGSRTSSWRAARFRSRSRTPSVP